MVASVTSAALLLSVSAAAVYEDPLAGGPAEVPDLSTLVPSPGLLAAGEGEPRADADASNERISTSGERMLLEDMKIDLGEGTTLRTKRRAAGSETPD